MSCVLHCRNLYNITLYKVVLNASKFSGSLLLTSNNLLSAVLHFDYRLPLFLCILQCVPDPNSEPVLHSPPPPDRRVQSHVHWHVGHTMNGSSLMYW